MGRLEVFEVEFDNPHNLYYAGQEAKGVVKLTLKEETRVETLTLLLKGSSNTRWCQQSGQGNLVFYGSEVYFKQDINLIKDCCDTDGKGVKIPAGTHSYPFQHRLKKSLPSSFEGRWGRIRYYAQGIITGGTDHKTKKGFSIVALKDLNIIPGAETSQVQDGVDHLCCLWCRSDPIEATLKVPRTGFVPGETLNFVAEISNRSNRMLDKAVVELIQVSDFRSLHPYDSHMTQDIVIAKKVHKSIAPMATELWMDDGIVIPPLPPSDLDGSSMIGVKYFLQLTVDPSITGYAFPCMCTLHLEVEKMPLIIGNVPLRQAFADINDLLAAKRKDVAGMSPPPTYDQVTKINAVAPMYPPPAFQGNSDEPSVRNLGIGTHLPHGYPPDAPPPSYAPSVFGASHIGEGKKDDYSMGQLDFAPVYITFASQDAVYEPLPNPKANKPITQHLTQGVMSAFE